MMRVSDANPAFKVSHKDTVSTSAEQSVFESQPQQSKAKGQRFDSSHLTRGSRNAMKGTEDFSIK